MAQNGVPPPPSYQDIVSSEPASPGGTLVNSGSLMDSGRNSSVEVRRTDVPDSPHDSDDEETTLLKSELRRLRDQNTDKKKLDLLSAIEMERAYAAAGRQPAPVGSTGPPAMYQPTYMSTTVQSTVGPGAGQQVMVHPMMSAVPQGAACPPAPPPHGYPAQPAPQVPQLILPPQGSPAHTGQRAPQQAHPPAGGTSPWLQVPFQAGASSSSSQGGQLVRVDSCEPGNKQSRGSFTACLVVTFFVFGFAAVIAVAIYSVA